MKRIYTLVELENGWTITETKKEALDVDPPAESVTKRKYIATSLNEAADKVKELGA
jgi:hypothetical protein